MTITFYEDHTEISHWALQVVNDNPSLAWFRAFYKDETFQYDKKYNELLMAIGIFKFLQRDLSAGY
jgi:hypothetical protein